MNGQKETRANDQAGRRRLFDLENTDQLIRDLGELIAPGDEKRLDTLRAGFVQDFAKLDLDKEEVIMFFALFDRLRQYRAKTTAEDLRQLIDEALQTADTCAA